jgi:hypothetical protein
MLIVACQKCGEVKVIAGSPDSDGVARAVWTCSRCGSGQILELSISKDARRGDLRKIIGGMALAGAPVNVCGSAAAKANKEVEGSNER